ncbi:hypothetical protein HDV06_006380 [Boothiomyces sp. JEL0866]|nr:hypothetical protein HDV06_006380 [Boothiomyces sp. JEL0866]
MTFDMKGMTVKKLIEMIKPHLTPLVIFNLFLLFIIVVSGAILFMLIVNWIRLPTDDDKQTWFEVNSQILNACFTITAVMTQPARFMLFLWTCRWAFSQGQKKREYARMIHEVMPDIFLKGLNTPTETDEVVIQVTDSNDGITNQNVESTPTWKWYWILFCLNGQCIFQYPITFVQWAWIGRASERPALVIAVFLPLSFLCGAIGGIWPMLITMKRKKNSPPVVVQT